MTKKQLSKAVKEINDVIDRLNGVIQHLCALRSMYEWELDELRRLDRITDYETPGPVDGYDTIVGYLAKRGNLPEGDLVEATRSMGWGLTRKARRWGVVPIKVPAPRALSDLGITECNAYPVKLLDSYFA